MTSQNSSIQRIAERIRLISQSSKIQAQNRQLDIQALEKIPDEMDEMSDHLSELATRLKQKSITLRAMLFKNLEDAESLMTLAGTAADVSTILGKRGDNLKILTHSDWAYIHSILAEGEPEAKRIALKKLTPEQRKWFLDNLQEDHNG